jgi:hypothetical protein
MAELMTLDEKYEIMGKARELELAGDKEGANRLYKTAPIPPFLAKIMKEKVGVDYLLNSGWNLSEAEVAFGSNWLDR